MSDTRSSSRFRSFRRIAGSNADGCDKIKQREPRRCFSLEQSPTFLAYPTLEGHIDSLYRLGG